MAEDRWQWVRPSRKPTQKRKGYFRRRPRTVDHPTLPMRKARYAFAKAAHEKTGVTGKVEIGGKELPLTCKAVADAMKDRSFSPPKPPRVPRVLLGFTGFFEELGRAVAAAKVVNRDFVPRLILWQREYEKLGVKRELEKLRKKTLEAKSETP